LSPHHYFIPLSTDYSNLGQLGGQQYSNVKVPSYAYSLFMNMFKCFLYIQYGCGEKVGGVEQPKPCQHIIILPHHPHVLKSGSTCSPAVLQFKGALTCLSTFYENGQMVCKHTIFMWRKSEGSCKASTMSTHHYFIPLSQDYSNLGQLLASNVTV
jgi:hypothetical protein